MQYQVTNVHSAVYKQVHFLYQGFYSILVVINASEMYTAGGN